MKTTLKEREDVVETGKKEGMVIPFLVRFAERVEPPGRDDPTRVPQIYDDPTTVHQTGQYEDPHTDES